MDVEMKVIQCAACAMAFAVPSAFKDARLEDHKEFFCPAGHQNFYPGKSDVEKLQEKLKARERELEMKLHLLEQARKEKNAYAKARVEMVKEYLKEQFAKLDALELRAVAEHFRPLKIYDAMSVVRLIGGYDVKRGKNGFVITKNKKKKENQ